MFTEVLGEAFMCSKAQVGERTTNHSIGRLRWQVNWGKYSVNEGHG